MGSLSQFEENVDPLLRGHLSAGKGVRGIGCFEGVKNADYFLHGFILLSPRACCIRSSHTWAAARSLPRIAWLSGGASLRQVSCAAGTDLEVHALLRLQMREDAEQVPGRWVAVRPQTSA